MLASREPRTTGSQPWSTIGAASATVITANSSIVTTAIRTPGPDEPGAAQRARSNTTPASTTPTVASTAPMAWTGSSDSPRSSTARIDGRAAVRDDDRADHAQRPDPQRREVAQVRDGGPDAQRQAGEDPRGWIGAEPRAVGEDDHGERDEADELRPGQQAEAADPPARDRARDVHDTPRDGREQAEQEAGGHRRSLRSEAAGWPGCRVLHFPAGPPGLPGDPSGDVAQLGERRVRIAEARGSSPLISTIVGRLGRW